jgi:Undecaprenyl-phosphate galactose phosphotransferase WbaP
MSISLSEQIRPQDGAGTATATADPQVAARQRLAPAGRASQRATAIDDRSISDSAAFWISARRAIRTVLPIVSADAVALCLAGIIVQAIVRRLCPAAAQIVGGAAPLALLPLIVAYWLHDLYTEIWVHPVIEFRQLTHITSIGLLAAATAGALVPPFPLWCVLAMPAATVLVPLLRNIVRQIGSQFESWGYPTLVIGAGDGASQIAKTLLNVPRSGLRPVLLTDIDQRCRSSVVPVVNDPAILDSIVRGQAIRHAVISLPDMTSAQFAEVLDRYRELVPHLLVLSDTATLPTLWGASRDLGRLSGIEVRNGLLLFTFQFVKRAIDLSIASVLFLLLLPLMAVTAILIRFTSPGPIFYGQQRIGRHGRMFTAWKFRSMRADADAVLSQYLAAHPEFQDEWKRDHKLRDDPRINRLGAIIRRTSIDELPQLWNVLRGDMSLVGPRPIVQAEVPRYGEVFRLYTSVRPGISGLWQVSGRNDINYDGRVLLDQFYIRHWSPWLDVYVLAKTIAAVLIGSGAY